MYHKKLNGGNEDSYQVHLCENFRTFSTLRILVPILKNFVLRELAHTVFHKFFNQFLYQICRHLE
jgi:hypothetical protein